MTPCPLEWDSKMMNLATAYTYRIRRDRADNIEEAIRRYNSDEEPVRPLEAKTKAYFEPV